MTIPRPKTNSSSTLRIFQSIARDLPDPDGGAEGILKPLDQDLILIIAFKIKNKIRNRIGVKEPGSIEEE